MVCYRAGDEIGSQLGGRRGEALQLAFLLPWVMWSEGSQGCLLELGAWEME